MWGIGRGWFILIAVFIVASFAMSFHVASSVLPGDAEPDVPVVSSAALLSNGWERVFAAPEVSPGVPFHFYGMTWVNRQVGFAYGGADWEIHAPGRVYRTTDGGLTWIQVLESWGWKIALACKDVQTCWVGGQFGRIFATYDGGDSWVAADTFTWSDYSVPTPTPAPFTGWMRSGTYSGAGQVAIFGGNDRVILRNSDAEPLRFYNVWPPLPYNVATWSVTCATS